MNDLFFQILTYVTGDLFALTFCSAFLFRVLSGAQNGLIYNKSEAGHFLPVMFMLFIPIYIMTEGGDRNGVRLACIAWAFLATISFKYSFGNIREGWGIHEFETIGMYVFAVACFFFSPLGFILSVYPSLVIHKGLINIGSGIGFFDERTDNPTGKTFSFFGWNIPRLGNKIRIPAAVISFILFFVLWI